MALSKADGRISLRGNELGRRRDGVLIERQTITDPDELLAVLDREFGLSFPPGTRFRGGPA